MLFRRSRPHWLREAAPTDWSLPLYEEGRIVWNAQCVPYVVARNAHDAAVLAGAACYLLRGNQIQLFRHVAWGRLSELGGPPLIRVDTMIRSLDMHCAQDDILAAMPAETRAWIDAFCEGLNAVASVTPRNLESRLLGIHHRPFDVRDILAIGRLTGTDVNWPLLFDLLPLSTHDTFAAVWRRILTAGGLGSTSETIEDTNGFWLLRANRSGSNCMAVNGQLTASGRPLLASDPHLNHQLPNLWLLIGIQCPQVHAVGLMFPGVPVIGLGRNSSVAWGGTNLRAASSDLIRLSPKDCEQLTSRETVIRVRGWRSVRKILRRSRHGPVLSDHLGWRLNRSNDVLAMRWAGHLPSDEISAFLGLMQLKRADGLQACMKTYAVTGLNVLAADVENNIAQTHAAWLPARQGFSESHFVTGPEQSDAQWKQLHNSTDLPFALNPPSGHLLSTNQDPRADVPVSWYFNGEERNRRLRHLLETSIRVDVMQARHWHIDVRSPQAAALARILCDQFKPFAESARDEGVLRQLATWDGCYDRGNAAALTFEALLSGIRDGLANTDTSVSAWWVIQEWAYICNFLLEDFAALPVPDRIRISKSAFRHAHRMQRRYGVWGEAMRLAPRHVLGFLPWIGKRLFPAFDWPASGSRETLMKNAHGWLKGRVRSAYGAQARQICDLSSEDANWFVLLGGQDERVGSPHALDQAGLWSRGQYVRMPLSDEGIAASFTRTWNFDVTFQRHVIKSGGR